MFLLLLSLQGSPALAASPCASYAQVYGARPTGAVLAAKRRIIHQTALREGVDPHALEAIAMVETGIRPAIGGDCEIGPFQIMPFWAKEFGLSSPWYFWDLQTAATAAARIYRAGWDRWRPQYAAVGRNVNLDKAGFKPSTLDRATFASMSYNWGSAAKSFSKADNLTTVHIPKVTCRYAVRFQQELAQARKHP